MHSSDITKTTQTFILFFALMALLSLTGCIGGYLSVHSDYLNESTLASYYVNTPDPRRVCPPIGQRLIISWSVPRKFMCMEDLYLDISLRYRNHKNEHIVFPVPRNSGSHLISVLNDEYCTTGGILTYKIELVGNGEILEEWTHPIWARFIELQAAP